MKKSGALSLTFICILSVVILLAGCAAKKSAPWGNATDGFVLTYRSPVGAEQSYNFDMDMNMLMNVMGNDMETIITVDSEIFTRTKYVADDGSLTFGMGFNSLDVSVSSPQGDMSPDVSEILGKEIELVLSKNGKVMEIKNLDQLPQVEGMGQQIGDNLRNFFYNLPEEPVTYEESWTATDSYITKFGENETETTSNATYTLLDKRIKEEIECLRIGFEQTADIKSTGVQQGMNYTMTAVAKNEGELLFAYKEGYYIEAVSEGTLEGTIVMEAMGMEMPVNATSKMTTKLIKY